MQTLTTHELHAIEGGNPAAAACLAALPWCVAGALVVGAVSLAIVHYG